ncbi:MAG: ATP-binding protein, partial [Firmicutes bacterium]|nr:ATP-binding protein [Bacillota bacterium]
MITIIFGNPGCGKTSLLSALACQDMTVKAREYLLPCHKEIEALNDGGYCLTVPEKHIVFANIDITSEPTVMLPRKSWYVNPALIALPNNAFQTAFLPPYAQVYI